MTAKEFMETHRNAPFTNRYLCDEAIEELLEEYAEKRLALLDVSESFLPDIRDEMDADMQDSGMPQGEIESCLNHWSNKYVIQRK